MGKLGKSFEFYRIRHVPELDSITPRGMGSVTKIFKFDMRPSHKTLVYCNDGEGNVVKRSVKDCNVYNIEDRNTLSNINIDDSI